MTNSNANHPGMSVGVQTWSRGDIFPAVISKVEEYDRPCSFDEWRERSSQVASFSYSRLLYESYLDVFFDRSLDERLISRVYVVNVPGHIEMRYSDYDSAYEYARTALAYDAQVIACQEAAEKQDIPCIGDSYGEPHIDQDSIDRYARRTYASYTQAEIDAGEMAGGSPVSTKHYQRPADYCPACAAHYGPTDAAHGACDQGKPVASPHRKH